MRFFRQPLPVMVATPLAALLASGAFALTPVTQVATLSASQFQSMLASTPAGQDLLQIAGTPKCGVTVIQYPYLTLGARSELTNATGSLMLPNGTGCTGARPTLLYAHGTAVDRNYNMADLRNNSEASMIAAIYAAQGYIVVAPNYAGYRESSLPYHPYLVANQQSRDMLDGWTWARMAMGIGQSSTAPRIMENGKLFIAGYSQGGHVAMATQRLFRSLGIHVAAAAPSSGPYAMAAFGDLMFYGNTNIPAPLFANMLANSYQKAYGIYAHGYELYESRYAGSVEGLLPSSTPIAGILQQGLLPQLALFSPNPPAAPAGNPDLQGLLNAITPPANNPLAAQGFGTNNLITNEYRLNYILDALAHPDGSVPSLTTGLPGEPQHPLRKALKENDFRSWARGPAQPTLLCGGNADPTVFYMNTTLMKNRWASLPTGLVTTLDVDGQVSGNTDPFAAVKLGFASAKTAIAAAAVAAGATDGGQSAVASQYHGLAAPFCMVAARGFFQVAGK